MQQNLADFVLQTPDTLVFPLLKEELELLYDNPVAFSSYIKVWYDGVDLKHQANELYLNQIEKLKNNEQDWLWHTFWVIVSIKDRTIIGNINFIDYTSDSSEIYCLINKKYHNLGFATKSIGLISEWSKSMGLKQLVAKCDKDNISLKKVLEKNNFIMVDKVDNCYFYKKVL